MTLRAKLFAVTLLAAVCGAAWADGDWTERWLFNPQERTRQAVEAMARGETAAALELLETAMRLDESTEAVYNVGTARLAAGAGDPQALLLAAAEFGSGPVVPSAHYNLGNAWLAADDLHAAIDAYKKALRLDPDFADAKFNLELARRLLEEEQEQQEQEQQDQQKQEQEQDQQQEQEERQQEQEEQQEPQPESGDEEPQDQQQDQQQSPLPQFRELPDMTAEEAAAILEAVENMERERRRQETLERAKANVRGKKDW